MAGFQDYQWLQPVLGVIELSLLLAAVIVTVRQFTRSRASSYIERFNSSDMLESRSAVDGWLRKYPTRQERLEALEADPALSAHLKKFANLFQELGAAYQFGVAHRKTVRVLFDELILMYWERLRFWIFDYRASQGPSLYSRFELLYNEIKRPAHGYRHPVEYVVAYGSLMDPDSIEAAIGRRPEVDELLPVTVDGYRRSWSITEQIRIGQNRYSAVFLDVESDANSQLVALIFRVRRGEMNRLVRREKNYEPTDVAGRLRLAGGRPLGTNTAAYLFVGNERHRGDPTEDDAVVLRAYVERVAKAAGAVDDTLPDEIMRSAAASGFRQVPGDGYEFVDPVQASLV